MESASMNSDLRATIALVRNDGRNRDAVCPAHPDRHASLSVGRGADDLILLHGHAGCSISSVLAAAGLKFADLFTSRSAMTLVATYNYTDENGTLLYQVCRVAPKDFRQRRADGSWNMRGVRRVLYYL